MDSIDRSDHPTDHAHARQDQSRAETSKTEALVLYDALPAWHDIVPTVKYCPTVNTNCPTVSSNCPMDRNVPSVKLIYRSDTDCRYWTCIKTTYNFFCRWFICSWQIKEVLQHFNRRNFLHKTTEEMVGTEVQMESLLPGVKRWLAFPRFSQSL